MLDNNLGGTSQLGPGGLMQQQHAGGFAQGGFGSSPGTPTRQGNLVTPSVIISPSAPPVSIGFDLEHVFADFYTIPPIINRMRNGW